MRAHTIEALPEVQEASHVLAGLEQRGLVDPAIASGWTRGFLTDVAPSDIDIAYVGPIPHEQAREHLKAILKEQKVSSGDWDIDGIWNAEQAYGIKHTVENYLRFYVCSIDTVYLAADGKLHDPTGHGFADAQTKTLRLNSYDVEDGRVPTPAEDVYICMEGCRRITKLGWAPTADSETRIRQGVAHWDELTEAEQRKQISKKVIGKYLPNEFDAARSVYERYGWGFVFDLAVAALQAH